MPCATSEIKPIKKEEKSNLNPKTESNSVLLETTGNIKSFTTGDHFNVKWLFQKH